MLSWLQQSLWHPATLPLSHVCAEHPVSRSFHHHHTWARQHHRILLRIAWRQQSRTMPFKTLYTCIEYSRRILAAMCVAHSPLPPPSNHRNSYIWHLFPSPKKTLETVTCDTFSLSHPKPQRPLAMQSNAKQSNAKQINATQSKSGTHIA
jgi:hypothetical protein